MITEMMLCFQKQYNQIRIVSHSQGQSQSNKKTPLKLWDVFSKVNGEEVILYSSSR